MKDIRMLIFFRITCAFIKQDQTLLWPLSSVNIGVTDYTNQTPYKLKQLGCIKFLSTTDLEIRKYLSNAHKLESAHVQYVNNHYAKFEY